MIHFLFSILALCAFSCLSAEQSNEQQGIPLEQEVSTRSCKKHCSCKRKRKCTQFQGFVPCNGLQLFTTVQGCGKQTIVFLHGFPADSQVWNQQRQVFNKCYRTLAYDQRGFGKSSQPTGPYDVTAYAQDLRCILDHFSIQKPIIVAHSFATEVVLKFISLFPDRVCKLVLVSGNAKFLASPDYPFGVQPEFLQQLVTLVQRSLLEGLTAFVNLSFPEPNTEALKKQVLEQGLQSSQATVLSFGQGIAPTDVRSVLPSITIPTLIVHGTNDNIFPFQAGLFLRDNIRNSQFVAFEGKGHFPFLTDPTRFTQVVENFLRSTPACCR